MPPSGWPHTLQSDGLVGIDVHVVDFPPEVIGSEDRRALLSWRAHPLLFPFARSGSRGVRRSHVPVTQRAHWSTRLAALEAELHERRDGSDQAALALLTLLLVDVSRLAADVAADLRLHDEPLLAAVFEFIEAHYREPVSLRDVARACRLSPAHLTSVVSRKTGRPVQQWITERRMSEARRRLVDSDIPVAAIGAELGYRDPSYFVRTFRQHHGATPLQWRRGGR